MSCALSEVFYLRACLPIEEPLFLKVTNVTMKVSLRDAGCLLLVSHVIEITWEALPNKIIITIFYLYTYIF